MPFRQLQTLRRWRAKCSSVNTHRKANERGDRYTVSLPLDSYDVSLRYLFTAFLLCHFIGTPLPPHCRTLLCHEDAPRTSPNSQHSPPHSTS